MPMLPSGAAAYYRGVRAVRVGPSRRARPAASIWKFWIEKDELYASARVGGHMAKVSVHASGQIHWRLGARNVQEFAPPVVLGLGLWLHTLEIRFLLSAGAGFPPERLVKLKKKKDKALLVEVPEGQVLYLNLLVSAYETPSLALPQEFRGAPEVWRATLANGRAVVLLGRVMPYDEQSTAELRHIRETLQPKANFTGSPSGEPPYVEVIHAHWGHRGNVILVTPMGPESYRCDAEIGSDDATEGVDARSVTVECPGAYARLIAPDGSVVGSLSIVGGVSKITLTKGRETVATIARADLSIIPGTLRWGESFVRPRGALECTPAVGGAEPKGWHYGYEVRFDGAEVSVAIVASSCALRNANVATPIPGLASGEEIIMRAPAVALRLTASRERTAASADLTCGLRLRDI